ncbi:MAG: bacterial Ig-like domain-containing protein, partial [Clostridia bacterium]|nr:bacterial Ig-like domain-containing protein [Clostridia bacterium]
MKKILCALLIFSMLIIPAACQRTDVPQGDKSATENGTVAPGWVPGDSEDDDASSEQGESAESGEENGLAPDSPAPVEIPTVTEAVPDKEVKSISIKTEPKTTVYYAGSPIDTTGLTVNVKFKDGTEKTIAGGFGYSPTVASQGVKKVTVSYGGKTDSFGIKVKDDALKSISIKSKPDRLTYAANEKIDTTGLVINAEYESGTVRAVSKGFTVSPESFGGSGTRNVTVSYGGKTATFPVTVKSGKSAMISTIRVTSKPNRISYYLNEKLDTKGMVVTVNYTDGSTEDLTEGFKCSPVNLNEKGVQKIIVTYENKSTAFNVTVKEDVVKSIEIKQGPKKVNYYQGDVLETEGLELTVDYENSPSKTISSGFACSPTLLNEAGLQTITVTYAGRKKTFTVRVKEDVLQSIEVKTNPIKRTYYVGDSFDTEGLTLRATYLSGRVKTVTEGYTYSPSEFQTAGDSIPVRIYYGDLSLTLTVKVKAVTIETVYIEQKPTKTKY